MNNKKHTVYLALGSNMGSRLENINKAVLLLTEKGLVVLKESSVIETDPVGGPMQGKFLNAALKAETQLNPEDLLLTLKSIEVELGRKKTIKNDPRPIDIDILLYDNISMETPTLTIPHPRMLDRDFVMRPLQEIEPDIIKQLNQ